MHVVYQHVGQNNNEIIDHDLYVCVYLCVYNVHHDMVMRMTVLSYHRIHTGVQLEQKVGKKYL